MPKLIYSSDNIIKEGLVEYNLKDGEEIFLTYSHGREYGPGIERTGKGPPVMDDLSPGALPGSRTTHPFGQRLRTWYIQDHLRAKDLDDVFHEIKKDPPRRADAWRPDPADPVMIAFQKAIDD